jgi:spore maturation protein CgeB
MKKKNKKKILLIGSNEFFTLEGMYFRAFKKAQCDVKIFHVYNISKNLILRIIWKYLKFFFFLKQRHQILNYVKNNKNKYNLIVIFKGLYLTKKFIIDLKKINPSIKFINIFPDDPFDVNYFKDISNRKLLKSIKFFDYFFIYSKKIKRKLELILPSNKTIYLPFAHDETIHKKLNFSYDDSYDLSFVGTADKERYNFLKKLSNYTILVAGNGWKNFKQLENVTYIGAVNTKKSAEVIKKSTISLNILRKQNYSSHNMRTFEIPAMGGLMLTKRSKEQNNFFRENKECLMYEDFKELNSKIKMILKDKKKFFKIQNNGYKVSKKYTYLSRVKHILKIVYQ